MKTQISQTQITEAVEEIIRQWMVNQRAERGDAFATETEMTNLLADPQGWLSMLRGEDAYSVLQSALGR